MQFSIILDKVEILDMGLIRKRKKKKEGSQKYTSTSMNGPNERERSGGVTDRE